ncbi:pentapeptide repeat-containing protein [Corallococcus exiguus]|nr:pentapeptide repeat-containing protein [Corallococcus exiguus]NNC00395.1 pentapeptide repeat-containing protein [Corallococcus exiguus]NNC09269.1 pentapeptide repeat-containing protein [Corallococcus exiguus]NPC51675.1 pentapeptide repeat-containing protein [Corallococcus exiguus]RKH75907.1 pentapeptide repeat-containing protein [Corallococcus sp. AB032C]
MLAPGPDHTNNSRSMPKAPTIEKLLQNGSAEWNKLRKSGQAPTGQTGATFTQLFSANADLSGLELVGSEWERCDLSKMNFRDTDLTNAYFHGGRLQDCDFRGANLEGCVFEKLKLLRCDFTGAKGLEDLEMDDVDMDRVTGLDGEEAPPPPPPPVQGITAFTREQREKMLGQSHLGGAMDGAVSAHPDELPPFRPQDPPGSLFFRALKRVGAPPLWVLDVPGLRPLLPQRLPPGSSLETLYREAVKTRLENKKPAADPGAVERAQKALRMGGKEANVAAVYLREVGVLPLFRFAAAKQLKAELRTEVEVDDLTGSVDPRTTGALLELRLTHEVVEHLHEVRRRLAAAQLYSSLLEAGFNPENNWDEALESADASLELANAATGEDRQTLLEGFQVFAALPEEARLRRLAYLAESVTNLELLSRLPEGMEPQWLSGPEVRECHEREMTYVQSLKAQDIPAKVPALAKAELGVPEGEVPEESDDDLFVHVRCDVCGKEKLIVQSPEA